MPKQWNVLRLSGIGFICGAIVSTARELFEKNATALDPAYLIGLVIGGGIGGAILFAIVASVRNFFSR
jgi:hypothetical protein